VAIETADIIALRTAALAGLTSTQISTLTTGQVSVLTSAQVCSISTQQAQGLTTDQLNNMSPLYSPIVLDLNGDGITTLGLSAGVNFDLRADGTKVNTGWVGGGDGLLALDRNGDGVINDGSELFGNATSLNGGGKAGNGYQALAELDSNGDGVVDAKDGAYADLRVWVDGNADGVSQQDELKSLTDLGITKLSLNGKTDVSVQNGNFIGITSTYETADGASHAAADVWFSVGATSNVSSSVSNLSNAMSSFNAAAATAAQNATKLEVPGNTTASVAALASAIGSYDSTQLTAASNQVSTDETQRLKALLSGNHSNGILAVK
jgi:hypothetical protein